MSFLLFSTKAIHYFCARSQIPVFIDLAEVSWSHAEFPLKDAVEVGHVINTDLLGYGQNEASDATSMRDAMVSR